MRMTDTSNLRRLTGFSILELMIAIVVGMILLTMALPNFISLLERNRINSAAEQLYVSLAEARGEALKRRNDVRICPSANSSTCRNDGDWSEGWLIFDNADGDGSPTASEIIKAVPGTSLASGVNFGVDAGVDDFVEFGATGTTMDSGTTGAFRVCHAGSNESSREISVSLIGRVDDTKRAQSDCGATIDLGAT